MDNKFEKLLSEKLLSEKELDDLKIGDKVSYYTFMPWGEKIYKKGGKILDIQKNFIKVRKGGNIWIVNKDKNVFFKKITIQEYNKKINKILQEKDKKIDYLKRKIKSLQGS